VFGGALWGGGGGEGDAGVNAEGKGGMRGGVTVARVIKWETSVWAIPESLKGERKGFR